MILKVSNAFLQPQFILTHMQALVEAQRNSTFEDIYKSTVGAVFMGTPFRGTEGGITQDEFIRIAAKNNPDHPQPQARVLQILRPDSEVLEDTLNQFNGLDRVRENSLRRVCFFESKPANVGGLVQEPGRARVSRL